MFVDSVVVKVQAGKGGDGLMSFRREKFIDKGGPDGGDGGHGGSVLLRADHNLNSLAAFRHTPLIRADDGEPGRRQRSHGKSGQDSVIVVPVGTTVLHNNSVSADLVRNGQETVVAKGGRGGFGNAHFTSSTRRAPRVAEIGEPGEDKELQLELKLIADVGLVGLPNAGKSTLLSVISNAKPAVADYPFTTLSPHLGVADIDQDSLLVADIPGLIAGASKGKGLGDDFLRHIERTMVLLHLIDATAEDVVAAYQTIQDELRSYKVDMGDKPQIVVLTKIDNLEAGKVKEQQGQLKNLTKEPVMAVSAQAHQNLTPVLRAALKLVKRAVKQAAHQKPATAEIPVLTLADDPNAWWIEKQRVGVFKVKGQKVEGLARRTNLAQRYGEARLRDILHKLGIDRELVRLGIAPSDQVKIADKKIRW